MPRPSWFISFQLDALAEKNPDRFKLWYTLDRPTDGWKYDKVMTSDE